MTSETCCGCCSLKTGTIIIGATGIVLSLILLILNFTLDIQQKMIDHSVMETISIINIIINSVNIGISTLLIIGILKEITCLMLPWLILDVLGIVSLFVFIILALILFLKQKLFLIGFFLLISGLIAVAIYCHLWLVVYNYRKELLIKEMNNKMSPDGRSHNYQKVSKQSHPVSNPYLSTLRTLTFCTNCYKVGINLWKLESHLHSDDESET